MRVGSGVILFQLAGFLTSALADFYFAKHSPTLAYLASELSGYVNGQCISICGGCFNPV